MGLFDSIFKSKEPAKKGTALDLFPDYDFVNLPEDQFHKLQELMPGDDKYGVVATYVKLMEEKPERGIFTYCKVNVFANGNKNIDFTNDTPATVKIADVEKFTNEIGRIMGPEDGKDGRVKFMPYEKIAIEESGFWTGRLYLDRSPSLMFGYDGDQYTLHISMA